LAPGANIPVVVGIVGGLLIAAAFLAFVAAHWMEITRLLRLAILLAGLVVAYGLGAWFARAGRTVLADLCAGIGAIVFGAGLALAWNSRVAAHLVALAALPWWIAAAFQRDLEPTFVLADGAALLFGAGLALAAAPWQRASSAGAVLSSYGAFSLATVAILEV